MGEAEIAIANAYIGCHLSGVGPSDLCDQGLCNGASRHRWGIWMSERLWVVGNEELCLLRTL